MLLTCSPQALPTVACGSILICTSTPASYSPVFSGRGVGDTPSRACAARPDPCRDRAALGELGVRRGGPAGWAALRPPRPCPPPARQHAGIPHLRRSGLAERQRDISTHRCGDARGERDPLCVCVYPLCPSSFSLPGRFSARPTLPSLPGSSRSVAPCVGQKSPEGLSLFTPGRRSLHGGGTSFSSDKSLNSPNSVFLPLLHAGRRSRGMGRSPPKLVDG